MPPLLVSPYTPRVGTQILLADLHYPKASFLFSGFGANRLGDLPLPALPRPNQIGVMEVIWASPSSDLKICTTASPWIGLASGTVLLHLKR